MAPGFNMQNMLTNALNLIKNYWYLVIVFIALMFILKLILTEFLRRMHQKWIWRQEKKREIKEKKKIEKEQLKYRTYKANNWLYNDILKFHTIVFKGLPGAGKTSGALNFVKFLTDRLLEKEKRNRRYYEVMAPEFIKQRDQLQEQHKLPFYTNMDGVLDLNTGFTPFENAEDIVFQRKKANTPCVVLLDESSDILGKDDYLAVQHEQDIEKRADNDGAKQTAKKLRHLDMWLFLTDQGGGDIIYTVRSVGYQTIEYIETKREISKKGKVIQKLLLLLNKTLPGWLTSKPKLRFSECLFIRQKIKIFFKLFLPGSKMFEKQFYINRNNIYKKIKRRYLIWKQFFSYNGKCYWFYYNNYQTLVYNHKEFRSEYDEKFDETGTRKKANEGI